MNAHAHKIIAESDVKAIAASLVPELRQRAMQTDRDRRVPPENIKLLANSGLLGIFRAKKWGGQELSMRAHVDAVSIVAQGCQATAWVLGVYHAHDYIIGHMSEKAQEEVYTTSPHQAVAAVIGPRGKAVRKSDGSYVLPGSGRLLRATRLRTGCCLARKFSTKTTASSTKAICWCR
jgi:3-hydroxy-9,10-secoandrosta-1,3,5(10)-triene-9,17-dione monooxygenase